MALHASPTLFISPFCSTARTLFNVSLILTAHQVPYETVVQKAEIMRLRKNLVKVRKSRNTLGYCSISFELPSILIFYLSTYLSNLISPIARSIDACTVTCG